MRIGSMAVFYMGDGSTVTFSSPGLLTYIGVVASEFRPGTALRNGVMTVNVGGVVQQGYMQVSTLGVLRIGLGLDAGGNLTNFPAGTVAVMDTTVTYTLY